MKSRFELDVEKHNKEGKKTFGNSSTLTVLSGRFLFNPNIYKLSVLLIWTRAWVWIFTHNYIGMGQEKKQSDPQFKQSHMLLIFIDRSLQASAKQQARMEKSMAP